MKARTVRVSGEARYHHMPYSQEALPKLTGMTIRQAVRVLRGVDWGNIGGMRIIDLDDGTYMEVELARASDGGRLMSSQRARRWEFRDGTETTVRYYQIQ